MHFAFPIATIQLGPMYCRTLVSISLIVCSCFLDSLIGADVPAVSDAPVVSTQALSPVSPPDAAAVKIATVLVHSVYAGRYAAKDEHGKRIQARMMLRHATWHRDKAALEMVLLRESLRLASEANDVESVLLAIDALDAGFTGIVVADERRKALEHTAHKAFTVALLKILDAPDDAHACGVAGRWLGMVAGRWAEALPVLRRATEEPTIQQLAERDATAATPAQTFQSAQAWLNFSKTAKTEERVGVITHALALGQAAMPGLVGSERMLAEQFIAKLTLQIPLDLDTVDWSTLTAEQWDRIPTPSLSVIAKIDRTDSGYVLTEGEVVRVVPHPTDTWSFILADSQAPFVTDWHGAQRSYTFTDTVNGVPRRLTLALGVQGFLYGAVLAWTDLNHRMRPGIVHGPGKLWVGPSSDHKGETTTSGAIRFKIVPAEE